MTDVCLVLTDPYAYEQSLAKAIAEAEQLNSNLKVVFFISHDSLREMVSDLGEKGWLGSASLRNLQNSMLEGYRALAEDVLEEIQQQTSQVKMVLEGVVEEPSLENYLKGLLAEGKIKLIVSGAKPDSVYFNSFPEEVAWIEE